MPTDIYFYNGIEVVKESEGTLIVSLYTETPFDVDGFIGECFV